MKRLLVLLALTALAAPTLAKPPSAIYPPAHPKITELFEAACEYSKLDCTDLNPPFLMVMETGAPLGFHILGTNMVFLSDECTGRVANHLKCNAIIVHEIVHYIVTSLNHFPIDPESCLSEGLAWDVYNEYVRDNGGRKLWRRNWKRDYPECRG